MSTPPLWARNTRTVDSTHTSPRKPKAKTKKTTKRAKSWQSFIDFTAIAIFSVIVTMFWLMKPSQKGPTLKPNTQGQNIPINKGKKKLPTNPGNQVQKNNDVHSLKHDLNKTALPKKLPSMLEKTCKASQDIELNAITFMKKRLVDELNKGTDTFLTAWQQTYVHNVVNQPTTKTTTVMITWRKKSNASNTFHVRCFAIHSNCTSKTYETIFNTQKKALEKASGLPFPKHET